MRVWTFWRRLKLKEWTLEPDPLRGYVRLLHEECGRRYLPVDMEEAMSLVRGHRCPPEG